MSLVCRGDSMTNCEEAYEYYKRKSEQQAKEQQEQDFEAMAKAVENYLQKWGHPHMTIIARLDGIEVVEGIKAKSFTVLD